MVSLLPTLSERHVEWTAPAALWDAIHGPTSPEQRRIFRTPAILRFAEDEFMPRFINTLNSDPHAIDQLLAVPETWRKPASESAAPKVKTGLAATLERARLAAVRKLESRNAIVRQAPWNVSEVEQPLKFYQPAHQRYYLITASLVCRSIGLPDRVVDTTKQERATFVIRMLQPLQGASGVNPDPADCAELALIGDEWKPVVDADAFADGETQYPLSPFTYTETDGRKRRVFNGLIPIAKREALVAAKMPDPDAAPAATPVDTRQMLLKSQVIGPWASLEEIAHLASKQTETFDDAPSASEKQKAIDLANEQIQTVSWYILLDLDQWLEENLNDVWKAVEAESFASLSGMPLTAYKAIASIKDGAMSLVSALNAARTWRDELESTKKTFSEKSASGFPDFRFRFIDAPWPDPNVKDARRAGLESALVAALDKQTPQAMPVARAAAQVNATTHRSPWFTVRCVFERPNCTAFKPAIVSDPSASFQMAAFFDPDAPARPIRVPMPADTTPAGLRKFDKNTAFVMSDILCGQVGAIRGLTFGDLIRAVLPFPLHKDLDVPRQSCGSPGMEFGMVCSFSIPIITICALILLMIIVKLLDIVFFWMPFFQLCLPVPKFDGKKG